MSHGLRADRCRGRARTGAARWLHRRSGRRCWPGWPCGGDYAYSVYRLGHHIPFGPAALALDQLWTPALVLFVAVILLFPDGRLPSPFARWAMRALWAVYAVQLAAFAVATAGALAAHPVRIDASGGLSAIDSPDGWFASVQHSALLVLLALALGFIVRQMLTWRRSSGERRQQLKWLASGAAVTIVSVILGVVFGTPGRTSAVAEWVDNFFLFGLAALPVSMGVAILRYRLYEIDRIISRTLAYTAVTGLLIGAYAALVLLSTHVPALSSSVAGGGLDAGRGGGVQPAATAGAEHRRPPVQPDPVRRGPDRGRIRGPAQGRAGPGIGPGRPGRRRDHDTGAGTPVGVAA